LAEKKKTTKKVTKKTTKKVTKKTTKKVTKKNTEPEDSGIVIVDDDLAIDRETELEERRAYLEEARSQEASSD
jgi:vacuolar-type H+-ATPase subunit F/Vma7